MAGCRVDASASHPLDSASASTSKHATSAYRGPIASCVLAPLLPFVSHSPTGCHITCCRVPPPCVTFCRAAAAILYPSSLFPPAGCCVASLRTASTSQRVAVSRLAVLLPLLMRRRLRHHCDCDCHPRRIPSSWRYCPHPRCRLRPSPSSSSTSVAIVVVVVSRRAVTMVIVVVDVARCAIAIIVDFAVRRAVAIIVIASLTLSSPVAPSP